MSLPPEIPYDDKTAKQIQSFYKLLAKKPATHKISETGSLDTYKKDGALEGSLFLKKYRPITVEERSSMEEYRLQQLAALDILYETERRKLREALEVFRATGNKGPVLLANSNVRDIELARLKMRSAIRGVKEIPIPSARDILFDEPYETRKVFGQHNLFDNDVLKDGLVVLERRDFPLALFYGRYEDASAAAPTTSATDAQGMATAANGLARVTLVTGVPARIFFEPDDEHNGPLTPSYPAKLVYKGTEYASSYQAFECVRAETLGKPEVRSAMLKTRSERTIRLLAKKAKGVLPNVSLVWTEILTALYEQHPELVATLVATGQDTLVYADPDVGGGGIGVAGKDKKALDPAQWKSENVVGTVLQSLRTRFREGAPTGAPVAEATEKVISEGQQAAAKTGAIIRARTSGRK